jgi:hypothetical protein
MAICVYRQLVRIKPISIAANRHILLVHYLACTFRYERIVVKTLPPYTVADGRIVPVCSLVCYFSKAGVAITLYQFPTVANGHMSHE